MYTEAPDEFGECFSCRDSEYIKRSDMSHLFKKEIKM